VWLRFRSTGQEVLVTFPSGATDTHEWEVIGLFPGKCVIQSEEVPPGVFPLIECQGTHWVYFPEDEQYGAAGYQLQSHDGVVVYYRPLRLGEKARPEDGSTGPEEGFIEGLGRMLDTNKELKVARLAMRSWDDFSFFLSDRGIVEPLHYLICESAFEGLPAQAVLGNGNVQRLSQGCLGGIQLEGELRGEVLAVAVSASGQLGLADDVITFYAGDPAGLFLPPAYNRVHGVLRATPGYLQGGTTLRPSPFNDRTVTFEPRPDRPLPKKPRVLEAEMIMPAAPRAFTHTIVDEGMDFVDMPDCGSLSVWTYSFHNRGLIRSLFPGTFTRVTEEGCGAGATRLFSIDYSIVGSGMREGTVGSYRVRAQIESRPSGRGIEVLRYRISYRDEAAATAANAP
jgi:hypothetical protein